MNEKMLPSYLRELSLDEIKKRAEQLHQLEKECKLCPNECLAKRMDGELGNCNSTNEVIISSVGPHFGEEPPLVGQLGSGTIFLTNCNLKCKFCQNYDISQLGGGYKISIEELAGSMMKLQARGCHNINFVTPTHFTPQIVEALVIAAENGLEIPLVYNCGGYESVETLKLLDNIFDIYMPDIKYSNSLNAEKYSGIKNYWEIVQEAVREMHRQVGILKISRSGIAQRGLIIRHLVLPNNLTGSNKVFEFIAKEISVDSYVNIMDQYRPAYNARFHNELNRGISDIEYMNAIESAKDFGLHRGF
jgi:putative pyruvate formate lyase activating enzyme